jgi:hypothetical protein
MSPRRVWYWEEDYQAAVVHLTRQNPRFRPADLDEAIRRLSEDPDLEGLAACGFHLVVDDDGNGEYYVEILVAPRLGRAAHAVTIEGPSRTDVRVPVPEDEDDDLVEVQKMPRGGASIIDLRSRRRRS